MNPEPKIMRAWREERASSRVGVGEISCDCDVSFEPRRESRGRGGGAEQR